MPAWFLPALKAVLPHVGTIVSAAAPALTRKSAASQTTLQQQITELQVAASTNDAHIKELATQIQAAVEALERGVSLAESRHRRMAILSVAAMLLSVTSLCLAVFVLFSH